MALSEEQKNKMNAARDAAAAKRKADKEAGITPAVTPAAGIQSFRPKVQAVAKGRIIIPKGTPLSGVQTIVDNVIQQMKAAGIEATVCRGRLMVS